MAMTKIQPELWVDRAGEAVAFYEAGFAAKVLHRVGEGDDIVAQLAVGDAAFWVAAASGAMKRFSPQTIGGATARMLIVIDDTLKRSSGRRSLPGPRCSRGSTMSTAG